MKNEFNEFQNAFVAQWQQYKDLQFELDEFRGKEVKELGDNFEKVNKLLARIQDNFTEMYPAMEFIIHNYKLCVVAVNEYNEFIEDLKKEGATPDSPIIEA